VNISTTILLTTFQPNSYHRRYCLTPHTYGLNCNWTLLYSPFVAYVAYIYRGIVEGANRFAVVTVVIMFLILLVIYRRPACSCRVMVGALISLTVTAMKQWGRLLEHTAVLCCCGRTAERGTCDQEVLSWTRMSEWQLYNNRGQFWSRYQVPGIRCFILTYFLFSGHIFVWLFRVLFGLVCLILLSLPSCTLYFLFAPNK